MKLLLDTHSFIWFISGSPRLSDTTRNLIVDPDNEVFLSIASIWEMAIKVSIGKLTFESSFESFVPNQLITNDITLLDLAISHTTFVATLPFHHRDPFDRILIAQSLVEAISFVSADDIFDRYGVKRIW